MHWHFSILFAHYVFILVIHVTKNLCTVDITINTCNNERPINYVL